MATDNIFAGTITCTGLTATGIVSFTGASTIAGLRTVGNSPVAITAARVLTAADSGGIFTVEQVTAGYSITLPTPPGAGLRFVLQLRAAAAFNVTVIATGCTFEGTVINLAAVAAGAAAATCTFVASTAAVGDSIEFISTSATKYFARAVTSAVGGITIA